MAFTRHTLSLVALLSLSAFAWEGRVAHLGAALQSDDAEVRLSAARRIGELRTKEAIGLVLTALGDGDPEVREAAAASAARLRAEEAIPVLASWLSSNDEGERLAAVKAIARIEHPTGTPALVRALLDPSAAVRIAVLDGVDARGELVAPVATCLDDTDSNVRAAAARSLGRGGEGRALFSLVSKLADDVPLVRLALVRALTDLGDPDAAPSLLGLTSDPEPTVRSAAVYAIGALGSADQRSALLHVLETGSIDTQRAALLALGEIGDAEAAYALARYIRHESLRAPAREGLRRLARNGSARLAVGRALLAEAAYASSPRELEDLGVALNDLTREAPLEALGPALVHALEESTLPRDALLVSLGESGAEEALLPLLLQLEAGAAERSVALEALDALFARRGADGRALEPVVGVLGSLAEDDERRALSLLGAIAEPRVTSSVLARLESPSEATRLAATRALGALDDARAAAALLALLHDANADVRGAAAEGLGSRSRPALLPELVARLDRRAPTDRASLLAAMGGLIAHGDLDALSSEERARVLAALEARVSGGDETLASAALDALARAPGSTAERALLQATHLRDVPLRAQAYRALGNTTGAARQLAARALLLTERAPLARAAIFTSLASLGDESDVKIALAAIERERGPVAQAASHALHELSRRGAVGDDQVDALCQRAQSRDAIVRANLVLAASHAGTVCPGLEPRDLLDRAKNEIVRAAAAYAMKRRMAPGDEHALARCATTQKSRSVIRACAAPGGERGRDAVDLIAFDFLGKSPLAKRPVALIFADGSVLVAVTDPRARVRLESAARGELTLISPTTLRLEP